MCSLYVAAYTKWWDNSTEEVQAPYATQYKKHFQCHIWDTSHLVLNVHVQRYIQSYCVDYNLTHEHKGTQWGGGGSYVEDHHQKVHHSYWKEFQEIVQGQSITMSPTLTAFQSV